jgi:hypothetical protein
LQQLGSLYRPADVEATGDAADRGQESLNELAGCYLIPTVDGSYQLALPLG